ncbi:filamentous hemagglutinin family protein [Actimicrobium sp. GrIS 1.19]|uniref:GLUG motif-containing protein n=1 Tax=Actimicrobium sp. GrIS 1.19 TaxID=3071708 RepID=UPI002E0A3D23|nr:filamentous hemagglutinin family protein [Actimicrobium sp. GrIS 1.19]
MNHIYRTVWNHRTQSMTAVAENARGRGKSGGKSSSTPALLASVLAAACALPAAASAAPPNALPTGGQVTAGAASISSNANSLTVNQDSQRAAINWQSFSVGENATVNFQQPNASSVILNRVVGTEQSVIAGAVKANGQVFLLNSNGVLFTGTSSVNVGGLVASTLNLSDADFMAGRSTFTANGSRASVINLGTINAADSGYVALLGNQVRNEGIITARLGTAIMGAGDKISLNFNGDSLVGVAIDQGILNALVENKQAIRADGGLVVLSAKGLDAVMATVVNNSGEIRAQTVANKEGKIYLLGGMDNNLIEVGGTLDASAPHGGNGGFIETSAANVQVKDAARVTTLATSGRTGTWLVDPTDFTIASGDGIQTSSSIGASTLSNSLGTTSVTLQTDNVNGTGAGDINVNAPVGWSANTTLTLNAYRNININSDIAATGSASKVALLYGQRMGPSADGNDYYIAKNTKIDLASGQNFTTKHANESEVTYTVIRSAADLQNIGNLGNLAGNFALGSNLDLFGITWTPIGGIPIGNNLNRFTGIFDGLGHTLNNLMINRTTPLTGLFGYVDTAGGVKNIGVINGNVHSSSSGIGGLVGNNKGFIKNAYFSGSVSTALSDVGGLVGYNYGKISTSFAIADVTSTSTNGSSANAGGLVGSNASSISDSYAIANVNGSAANNGIGGLVGFSGYQSTISNSYSSGTVTGGIQVGGLVGSIYEATINNAYTTSTVVSNGISSTTSVAGGLIGATAGGSVINNVHATGRVSGNFPLLLGGLIGDTPNQPSVSNGYWDTTTTGQSNARISGSLVGTTGIANADAYNQASYVGFDFRSTGPWFSVNGYTRPFLRMEAANSITNAHQLQLMSMNVVGSYTLANNIDLAPSLTNKSEIWKDNSASVNYSNYKGSFVPVMGLITQVTGDPNPSGMGRFSGQLDGLSHAIDHLYIYRPLNSEIGLFAQGASATFKNIGLTNVDVTGSGDVGGLVGYNGVNGFSLPTILNAYVTGSVTSNFSQFNVGDLVGGLTGYSKGTISNSYSTATVSGNVSLMGGLVGQNDAIISNSYATGNVSGTGIGTRISGISGGASQYIGGLVGKNDVALAAGIIQSTDSSFSYATGNVSGVNYVGGLVGWNGTLGTVSGAYATGNTTGSGDYVGGLAGQNSKTITNSYATGSVIGSANVGGLVGNNDSTGVINNSHAQGAVTAASNYTGGLAGSNYHTISGSFSTSTVNGNDWVGGLIGYNYAGAISTSYHTTGSVHGGQNVGGLVGQSTSSNSNSISDSYSSGEVVSIGNGVGGLVGDAQYTNITHSYTSATVSGGGTKTGGLIGNASTVTVSDSYATGAVAGSSSYVGGLVGNDNGGHYSRTVATGTVDGRKYDNVGGLIGYATNTHIDTSYATGTVHGGTSVGGLVGYMQEAPNTLENSYATGAVTGTVTDTGGLVGTVMNSTVVNAYSSGLTTGNANVGGLIGNASGSTITNSFWDNQTSGQVTSSGGAGVTGKTTAGMKMFATFGGTSPAWNIVVDPTLSNVYPQLRWATTGLNPGSSIWVIGRELVTYTVAGGTKTYGQSFALPAPSFIGGSPTATPTVKVYDVANNDVTSQATAGTLPLGIYTVKTLLVDPSFQLADSGNTTGTLTVGQGSVNYSVAGGAKTFGQSFTLPTPTITGGSPTATPTVKVFDSNNNDVTSQALAGTLATGTYIVRALLADTNYRLASSGNTEGVLTITSAVAGGGTSQTALGNAIADAIADAITMPENNVLSNNGLAGSPMFPGGAVPDFGQPRTIVNVTNPLPAVSAAFGPGERLAVVSSPTANEPTQVVTLSQARSMMQSPGQNDGSASDGDREVRVPASRNSLAAIVNGGVKLPDGVEQQMFVVQAN